MTTVETATVEDTTMRNRFLERIISKLSAQQDIYYNISEEFLLSRELDE